MQILDLLGTYVLWCCGSICHEVFTSIQIDSGHTLKDQLPFDKMSLKGQVKEENLIKELDIDVSQAPCYLDSLFFIHLSIIKCNTMNGMSKDHRKEQESHLQVFI